MLGIGLVLGPMFVPVHVLVLGFRFGLCMDLSLGAGGLGAGFAVLGSGS